MQECTEAHKSFYNKLYDIGCNTFSINHSTKIEHVITRDLTAFYEVGIKGIKLDFCGKQIQCPNEEVAMVVVSRCLGMDSAYQTKKNTQVLEKLYTLILDGEEYKPGKEKVEALKEHFLSFQNNP